MSEGLGLSETTQLDGSVLSLPSLLARPGGRLSHTRAAQSVCWFEFLRSGEIIVDDAKSSTLSPTKLSGETEQEDRRRVRHLVHLRELFGQFGLRYVGAVGMQYIDNLGGEVNRVRKRKKM